MSTVHLESPRSCRSHWPSAVFLTVIAAALAASLSGCMRAGANASRASADSRVDAAQVHALVTLEKKTADGRTVEVPLAVEYRAIRPATDAPAIPPSEMWPAQ
jgi:hypothetical protein